MEHSMMMEGIINGDEQAFRRFFHLYSDRLFRFASSLLGSPEEAEEVVSDVFMNIWQRRQHLGEVKNITTYLYSAVRNTSLNYLKKRKTIGSTLQLEAVHTDIPLTVIPPDDLIISKENLEVIAHAINRLPPACLMIFKLVKEDGLKYREVADILHLSINTVNVQMGIALKKISQYIRTAQHLNR